jgi:hypothetical protein
MNKHTPRAHQIDDIEERMGSVRELDFDDRHDERESRSGDQRPQSGGREEYSTERESHAGMTGGETLTDSAHEDNVTMDDLSPGTLFDESGANSPDELGDSHPLDKELSVVDESAIGGGIGLDEAELARSAPLDGKPWTDQVEIGGDEEE